MTRRSTLTSVDGKKIVVIDGALDSAQPSELLKQVQAHSFERIERSQVGRPDVIHSISWHDSDKMLGSSLGAATLDLLNTHFPNEGHTLYRVYTNRVTYGDCLLPHIDTLDGREGVTVLWFICDEWERDWGGETVFYDDAGEARYVVSPRPFRACLFRASIVHCGTPPRRICYKERYTLAWKFSSTSGA